MHITTVLILGNMDLTKMKRTRQDKSRRWSRWVWHKQLQVLYKTIMSKNITTQHILAWYIIMILISIICLRKQRGQHRGRSRISIYLWRMREMKGRRLWGRSQRYALVRNILTRKRTSWTMISHASLKITWRRSMMHLKWPLILDRITWCSSQWSLKKEKTIKW